MKKNFTLLEIIIVLVIVAILAGLGTGIINALIEKEYKERAKEILKTLYQAEENFFSWKNRYTSDFSSLPVDNPNDTDKFYEYEITEAGPYNLTIRATRRNKNYGLQINEEGQITEF